MTKPRKQTYTMDLFLKNIKEQDIRQDQDVQRLSDQWSNSMMNELIVTVLTDGYIPPIILAQEPNSQKWTVDGLQRGSTFMKFRYGNYKVTTSVEEPIITYCAKVKDADGEIMLDGNGDIVWEDRQFDIRNKTYDKLPEELKKIFDEYQIETVVHEGYSMAEISKFVRRYNFHKSMNTSQKMFTFVDRHARKIREILRKRFFVECTGYTKGERKNGTLERILLESVMCMFHLDNWRRSGQIGEYINENAIETEFNVLENVIDRLESIVTQQHYSIFNSRDSFIWFTLFYKFSKMGCDDERFVDFLTYFIETIDGIHINEFCGIDKKDSTKDKLVIVKKLDKLENMMCVFLEIPIIRIDEDMTSSILEFVHEHVTSSATLEDIEQYTEVLQAFVREIGQSKLWENENMPSLISIVAWSFEHDIDLDDWIVDYCSRTDSYFENQVRNYESMCEDLKQFIQSVSVA